MSVVMSKRYDAYRTDMFALRVSKQVHAQLILHSGCWEWGNTLLDRSVLRYEGF